MNKSQIQQITVLVLLVVFALVWTMTRRPPLPAPSTLAQPQPSTPSPAARDQTLEEPPAESATVGRDLFKPPSGLLETIRRKEERVLEEERLAEERRRGQQEAEEAAVALPPLDLQGVIWGDPKQPRALVNRQILRVGQSIEGVQILRIARDGIQVLYEGKEFFIPLPAVSKKEES